MSDPRPYHVTVSESVGTVDYNHFTLFQLRMRLKGYKEIPTPHGSTFIKDGVSYTVESADHEWEPTF